MAKMLVRQGLNMGTAPAAASRQNAIHPGQTNVNAAVSATDPATAIHEGRYVNAAKLDVGFAAKTKPSAGIIAAAAIMKDHCPRTAANRATVLRNTGKRAHPFFESPYANSALPRPMNNAIAALSDSHAIGTTKATAVIG